MTVVADANIDSTFEHNFERNFIGSSWRFPVAPYEYEIRSPVSSTVLGVVPLSSRYDVRDAVDAAGSALDGDWADRGARIRHLHTFLDSIQAHEAQFAGVQSAETGLSMADS